MTALIDMVLSERTRIQLDNSAEALWCQNSRTKVTDMIDVTAGNHIIRINPGSNRELDAENNGWDGKALIYAAFGLALDEYTIFHPGFHELTVNKNKPRTLKAFRFKADDGGKWHCFRWQNRGAVEIKFKDTEDPYLIWLRDNYMNVHDSIDLVIQGAYAEIDLSKMPELYDYFLSLMSMEPEEARATIEAHISKKIESNNQWQKSKEIEPLDEYVINGKTINADVVKHMQNVVATNDAKGYSYNVQGKNLSYLAQLVSAGYTLSTI